MPRNPLSDTLKTTDGYHLNQMYNCKEEVLNDLPQSSDVI